MNELIQIGPISPMCQRLIGEPARALAPHR